MEISWDRKHDINFDCFKIVRQFVSAFDLTEDFLDFPLTSGPELIVGNLVFGTGASESIPLGDSIFGDTSTIPPVDRIQMTFLTDSAVLSSIFLTCWRR
jgi:hypothetical protein